MSYEDHAAGVAEDYREALEGLAMNSRVEINNLTLIARENTEYGHAIAEVLQDHIRKVAPHRKLPALYVLDSIVKNVGTPYTLFFGRNLYKTFMEAYAAVDGNTRRKMDEMLKTWKEPVPGSIDTRPVFPLDIVRPIESALIQARTSALHAQQEHMRSQQQLFGRGRGMQAPPYRHTPTPPGGPFGARPGLHQSGPYGQQPFPGMNGNQPGDMAQPQQTYPLHSTLPPSRPTPPQGLPSMPPSMPYNQPPTPIQVQGAYGAPAPAAQPGISIDSLNDDIAQLVAATKAEFAQNPLDTSIQTRLKALLDLQTLVQTKNLPPEQLVLVKNQVAELSVKIRAPSAQNHVTPTPPNTIAPHIPPPQPTPPVAPVPPASAPPAAPGAVTLDSLLGKGALAALIARGQSTTPRGSSATPQPPAPAPAIRSPVPQLGQPQKPGTPSTGDPMSIVGMLRKAGILPGGGSASVTPSALSHGVPGVTTPARGTPFQPPPGGAPGEIQLKASSLTQFRPHLIPSIWEGLGPPCTQCGRRFRKDEQGRAQKTAHMDWHFRVHQRIAEAEKRGQHRSWYVDQPDWIKSREAIDVDYVAPPDEPKLGSGATGGGPASRAPPARWIPVPDDGSNSVCPICQERFETKWLDEAQEWVWMDAVRVGGRVYHDSCHSEATQDGGAGGTTPLYSRNTPEPVLGKRKAEDDHVAMRGKLKYETLPY